MHDLGLVVPHVARGSEQADRTPGTGVRRGPRTTLHSTREEAAFKLMT